MRHGGFVVRFVPCVGGHVKESPFCKCLLIPICVKSQWMCLWKIQYIKVLILSVDLDAHITNQKSILVQIEISF